MPYHLKDAVSLFVFMYCERYFLKNSHAYLLSILWSAAFSVLSTGSASTQYSYIAYRKLFIPFTTDIHCIPRLKYSLAIKTRAVRKFACLITNALSINLVPIVRYLCLKKHRVGRMGNTNCVLWYVDPATLGVWFNSCAKMQTRLTFCRVCIQCYVS